MALYLHDKKRSMCTVLCVGGKGGEGGRASIIHQSGAELDKAIDN